MAAAPCKLDEFLAKELARHHPGAQAPPTLAEMVNIEVIDPVFFPHNLQQSIYTEVLPAYRKTVAACGNVAKNPGNSESESARDEVLTEVRTKMQQLLQNVLQMARVADSRVQSMK
jgi:hypothetical protein